MVYHWPVGRNRICEGIILKNTRFGEIHKSVTLLTPDLGVINAIAHGAYKGKSKLGGSTEVFSHATIYLYHDPVRGSFKITDIEPLAIFEDLRSNLTKYYIGSLWAEVIIRTYGGGGEYQAAYNLLSEAISLLDACESEKTDVVLSLFLYRYVESLGYMPDFSMCATCGRRLVEKDRWYIADEGAVRCERCGDDSHPTLSPGARRYLMYATSRPLPDLLKVGLDRVSSGELKRAMIAIIQHIIGEPLKSLKGSEGII